MSNAIKDLSVFFSSPFDFEVEWHSSWSGKNYGIEFMRKKKKKKKKKKKVQ